MKTSRRTLLIAVGATLAAPSLRAQTYPARPIRLILPYSPGGTTDTPGRIIAQKLGEALGTAIIIDNRPGAGSTIGADAVAKAKPDGYTLLLTSTTHVHGAHLYKRLPYDTLADFTPIGKIAAGPYVLVTHPSVPANNLAEFIALAKSQPGKLDFASSGNGSSQHLFGALFSSMAGITLNHVPYKGSGPATQDLVGGQVKVGFLGTPIALPHVKAGRLRALGVSTATRAPQLPDVPTLAQAGVTGYEATFWLGLFAPAGTSPDIVTRLSNELNKVLANPEMQVAVRGTGMEVTPSPPDEFTAYVRSEYDKWGKVVRESGAVVN